jgi:hypothetical protein
MDLNNAPTLEVVELIVNEIVIDLIEESVLSIN